MIKYEFRDGSEVDGLLVKVVRGQLIVTIEQDDPEGGIGALIKTSFMPTKGQAETMASVIYQWAATK